MEYRDYYKILGVARTAAAEDIKKSYRRLARKYHPDVSKEKDAEQKFKEVQEAYEVLKDPEKRAAYDQLGSEWKSGQQFRPPPEWASGFEFSGGGRPRGAGAQGGGAHVFEEEGFSDFFSSLFGGASSFGATGRRQQQAGPRPSCPHRPRPRRGLRRRRANVGAEEAGAEAGRNTGGPRRIRCASPFPPGVTDGQLIRLAGQGETPPGGGRAGDLYLEVHIRPHSLYQVEARDVTLTLPIAPWEAALGATVTVPTLGGRCRHAGSGRRAVRPEAASTGPRPARSAAGR